MSGRRGLPIVMMATLASLSLAMSAGADVTYEAAPSRLPPADEDECIEAAKAKRDRKRAARLARKAGAR